MHLKMSSAKYRPFYPGKVELISYCIHVWGDVYNAQLNHMIKNDKQGCSVNGWSNTPQKYMHIHIEHHPFEKVLHIGLSMYKFSDKYQHELSGNMCTRVDAVHAQEITTWDRLNIKMASYRYRYSCYKDETLTRPSDLYWESSYPKRRSYIETGPCIPHCTGIVHLFFLL